MTPQEQVQLALLEAEIEQAVCEVSALADAIRPLAYPYVYRWGNNAKRKTMKGRRCRVICRGALNSCLIEFEDGQRETVSRNAVRRAE